MWADIFHLKQEQNGQKNLIVSCRGSDWSLHGTSTMLTPPPVLICAPRFEIAEVNTSLESVVKKQPPLKTHTQTNLEHGKCRSVPN